MGVESGGGGGDGGRVPPRNDILLSILDTYDNFAFFNIFKIKCPKTEEILNLGGR